MTARRRPEIDWPLLGRAIASRLFFDRLAGVPAPVRRAVAQSGVSRSTLWRAARGRRVLPAHFRGLCRWLGWPPERFHRDYWDRQLAAARLRRAGDAGQLRRAA